ncbi:hypothetical protein ACFWR9_04675 [Streptomyces sp. NPDC058534]|uniref:sodium:solute symporter family transporter n=1 Tax=Streptomyces sp. NPDC058534 TaxID=3346541 RepID=UPI0036678060
MNDHRLLAGDLGLVTPLTSFLAVVCLCFLLCLVTSMDSDQTSAFYTADRSLPALRNALALCGDYIHATALIGPIGTVALGGYDGMVVAVSASAALGILLVLAEPLRNSGRFTLGSILETRMAGNATRIAGTVLTVVVCVPLTVLSRPSAACEAPA